MSKHTSGKWQYDRMGRIWSNDRETFVAKANNGSDARLIASAPELLGIARLALEDLKKPMRIKRLSIEKIERVLLEAEGESDD